MTAEHSQGKLMVGTVFAIVCAGRDRLEQMLDRHLGEGTEKLLIVDAVADAEIPPQIISRVPEAELLTMAVADEGTESELIHYSLPGLYSFRKASAALEDLFPGLRERGRASVPNISGAALAAKLADYPDGITLVLNVLGEEQRLLTLLEQHGLLSRVAAIHLRCGAESYFDSAPTEAELCDWFAIHNFHLIHRDDRDSAWPELSFSLDRHGRQISKLERKLEAAQRDLRAKQEALKIAEQQLTEERKAAEARHSAVADHKKRQDMQVTELRKLRNLVHDREEAADRIRTEYERLRADQGTLLALHRSQSEELAALRKKYSALFDEKSALDDLLQKLTPRLQEAARKLHALNLLPHDDASELPESPPETIASGARKGKHKGRAK